MGSAGDREAAIARQDTVKSLVELALALLGDGASILNIAALLLYHGLQVSVLVRVSFISYDLDLGALQRLTH